MHNENINSFTILVTVKNMLFKTKALLSNSACRIPWGFVRKSDKEHSFSLLNTNSIYAIWEPIYACACLCSTLRDIEQCYCSNIYCDEPSKITGKKIELWVIVPHRNNHCEYFVFCWAYFKLLHAYGLIFN